MKKRYKTSTSYFVLLIVFCVFLVMLRMKITNSLFMGFLIWNLFLAYIPYFISSTLKKRMQNSSKFTLIMALVIWLLFLPNAPYIITDFIHLHHSTGNIVWLDIFILFTFSSTGIVLSIASLAQIHKILAQKWNLKFANYFSISTTFLCGFGVYLGRFLRFNSWDVFTSPLIVLKKSLLSTNDPKTWFVTISFGSFLYLLLLLFKQIRSIED
tara:strand:+ start:43195 stop:43830 length:636 start_codon:yes stop_codon:yes gene_type:complete